MGLYLTLALVLFLFALARLSGLLDGRYETVMVFGLSLLAFAASFLRWETGTDWESYFITFQKLNSFASAQSQSWWGPGYSYTALLVNLLGGNYTIFLGCIASVLFSVKYHLLTRSCAAPLVAVFVLFCANFFDIFFTRQSVGVVLFWAFIWYYYNRRLGLAAVAALAAVAFHYSAALPIAMTVALVNFRWRKVALAVSIAGLLASLLLVFQWDIKNYLGDLLGSMFSGSGVSAYVSRSLATYVGAEYVEEKASVLSTTLRANIKLVFWFFVIICGYLWYSKRTDSTHATSWNRFCLLNAAAIIVLSAALVPLSEIFARIPAYAIPPLAVVLSNYRFHLAKISVPGIAYLLILLLLFVQLGFSYSSYPDAYYPYKWIFS
jgi:hypothetical protein